MTDSRTGYDYITHWVERPMGSVITIDEPIRATLEELQILTIGQLAACDLASLTHQETKRAKQRAN